LAKNAEKRPGRGCRLGETGTRRGRMPRRVLCPDVVNDPWREVKIEGGVCRPKYAGALLVMALCGLGIFMPKPSLAGAFCIRLRVVLRRRDHSWMRAHQRAPLSRDAGGRS